MPNALNIRSTLRAAKRYPEILTVLARYGFQDFIIESGLDRLVGVGRDLLRGHREDVASRRLPRAVRVRKVLEGLGPTFIKMGQVLSTRPDLIPPDWAEEFKRLQDDCPQVPFKEIRARLELEFAGRVDEVFESIDPEALAAGSVAQVHRAVLADGSRVVVKVLRPGIRETVDGDMEVLSTFAHFMERHFEDLGYSPTEVLNEFSRELQRELDLTLEGQSADRLRRYFKDDPDVCFPEIHWSATTRNVLTMEEIQGTPLSRLVIADLTPGQRRRIIENGARAVFRQCPEFGFFHADPHPGNLMVLPDERICFIDCGMTGHLDARTAEQIADLVSAVVSGDLERVIQVSLALANVDPVLAEDRRFRSDAWDFVSRFSVAELNQLDLGNLLQQFFDLLREYRVRCPSDLVFLIKAITTIEGVGEELDPSFDIVGYVRPHIERLVRRRYSFRAVRDRMQRSLLRYVELAEELPLEARNILDRLRQNRFTVNLEHQRLERLNNTVEHASRNIAYALLIAALLIGSSILVLAEQGRPPGTLTIMGIVGFVVAGVSLVVFLVGNLLRKRE